jgi:hypothetical protein
MTVLRYVILHHDGIANPHVDLMFEKSPGSMLMTWRSAHWPIDSTTVIEPLPDHRRDYLDYEGPVSRNRGEVRRIAAGTFQISRNDSNFIQMILDDGTKLSLPIRS